MKDADKDKLIATLQTEISTLKYIISMMPGNVFWKNTKGDYLGCNTNMANIFNLPTPEFIIGKNDTDLMGPELGRQANLIDAEVMKTKQEKYTEELGFNIEGKPATYLTQKKPLYDLNNNIQGVLGIAFDISDRKMMEKKLKIAKLKAQTANRAKSQFLAMISHELRTPLTSILGFTNLIEQPDLDPKIKQEYVKHVNNSGAYLLSLINNLLDFNKLETNKFKLTNFQLNLKELIENVNSMLSGAAKLKNISLLLNYDENAPLEIMSNAHILKQILINLIANAVKFTEKGHVLTHVTCIQNKKKTVSLLIAVEDTGVGIALADQRSIFKEFHQLENVYTRNSSLSGTGLGLAIVKKLTKLLGSKIKVKSLPNKGSTFYFSVTFMKPISNNKTFSSISDTTRASNHYVLLVEDNELIQIIHKHMLEELGCKVDIANSAHKALKMLHNDYSMIFVDIGLPDITGFELIKTIRKKQTIKYIPITVITGYSEDKERQQCLNAGANEVIIKPADKSMLKVILDQYNQY